MKAVILAAGMGSRLGRLDPKSLARLINEKTIFDYQIERLSKYIPTNNIYVVVGYRKEMIIKRYPKINYIYNEAYAETNTGKSLLKALSEIDNDDVLWLNGDVVFDERLIPRLLAASGSCILVDKKECDIEEVKYNTNSQGYIKNISKEAFPAEGEALGINLIKRGELPILKKHLALIYDQDYFEKAIENMIEQENIKFIPINVNGLFCCEIDFPEDLEYARKCLLKDASK